MLCRILAIAILAGATFAADWMQFRGPNGSGIGDAVQLPLQFGPEKNVVWKTAVPWGYSSPVIAGDLIFITGAEGGSRADAGREKVIDKGGRLYTLALSRTSGKILWRREAPRPRQERYQPTGSPASPSAVTDGENVFVFFGDFGLLAYSNKEGVERWRLPLGPFNNVNGHGSSPILYRDLLILVCDQDTDSYLLAVDKKTGRVRWKTPRPESTRSYVTPAIFQPKDGPAELIVPGAYQVTSYYAGTGEKAWWVRGFSWQPKSLPVIDGDTIYVHGWEGGGDAETPTETPTFAETLAQRDKNHDGKLSVEEFADDPRAQKGFSMIDLNDDGFVDERDWNFHRAKRSARNTLLAIRHGGRGDVTRTNVTWSMQKFLPNCPSPLVYQGVLYLVKDGGILTAIDPKTGKILKQGRLPGALGAYYASPVGAAGKVFLTSQEGKVTVIKPGADWEILAVNDLGEEAYATPAIVDNKLYVRTRGTMYSFSDKQQEFNRRAIEQLTPEQKRLMEATRSINRDDWIKAHAARESTGMTALPDLGKGYYNGEQGGLYPGGVNTPPADHLKAGQELARRIVPLDAEGRESASGKIVLMSVGMSNTTMKFQTFQKMAQGDSSLNPRLVIVDGAQGGQVVWVTANPKAIYWDVVDERLAAAGVTRKQVQAAWVLQATPGPMRPWPVEVKELQRYLVETLHVMQDRFPKLKIAYLSSRTYAGYATSPLNPEPHAYESGFALKWLIADQIAGKPELNYDPSKGPVRAPWCAWGPYVWADGTKANSAGLSYVRADYTDDGTHPSGSGREKVAGRLLQFLKTDSTAQPWFMR